MSIVSAAIVLFLVMDPIGNVPLFLSVLRKYDHSRQRRIVLREMIIALAVLIVFLFTGRYILVGLGVSEQSLSIAGGIILFIIALRLIFAEEGQVFGKAPEGEPLVFPLAVPFIAGPSAMATLLLYMARAPERWPDWLIALFCAWLASTILLTLSSGIVRLVGPRTLAAAQRLMGLLLTTVAVEMSINGIRQLNW
ncbi:MAG: NAAT family transporter [Chitinivibrionales bacterium]|nr:NAAT family transporter [Chitinivibrionales bacterium]